LFSIGLELSLARLGRVLRVALLGAGVQIILVTFLSYFLLGLFGVNPVPALILSLGFSLSSTAVVVKILADRGETDTIHGEVMIGWLLVQDLAVIPMMVVISALAKSGGGGIVIPAGRALLAASAVVGVSVVVGRTVAPFLIHKVATANSRELLVLAAVALALGTAGVTSLFGISPALGAFLAGVVIAESQENHAVFAETRPLRDLFVAMFFVTMGFLLTPQVIFANFWLIIALAVFVLVVKFVVVFLVSLALGYHGKTAVAAAFGLAQIGEFSFVIFSQATILGLLKPEITSIGIATTLLTLVATPFLFKSILPFWRKIRDVGSSWPLASRFLLGWDRKSLGRVEALEGHIIVCGFGRVGSWVGKALDAAQIPFVVVEYNQKIVNELSRQGRQVIYGDPTEPEVLEAAGIKGAKAIVLAIPDSVAQEELVAHVQTISPSLKIISRAHQDADFEKLKLLKVDKVVQPEFEAAVAIVKGIFSSMGKEREEINARLKNLRLSRSKT
ncbi:MAG: cation:proton antiporter, partial [Patescibacteria group bacterium]